MNIFVNGKELNTKAETIDELCSTLGYDKDVVKVVQGYSVEGEEKLQPNMRVVVVDKKKLPDSENLKEMMSSRMTPGVYEKYSKAKVAVAGLGGLGSNIAIMLARSGIGHLHLIDFDVVEPTNLNRQCYGIKDLGMYKTDAIKRIIEEINPYIAVKTTNILIEETKVEALFENEDIICEAFDNAKNKAMLVNTLALIYPDKYVVAASGMAGSFDSNLITTKKLGDKLFVCGDFTNAAAKGMGLMAPRVSICAGHEANKVLQIAQEIY